MQTMFLACATHGPTQEIGQGISKKLGDDSALGCNLAYDRQVHKPS